MFEGTNFDESWRGMIPIVFTDAQRKSKVKRPPNAYNLYFMEQQRIVKAENPEMSGNDVSKELGRRWKEMNDEERRPYMQRSKEIWDEFRLTNPDYHYEKNKGKNKKESGRQMFGDLALEDSQLNGYWVEWLTSQVLAQYAMQNREVSDGVIASITSDSLPLFLSNIADSHR